MSGKAEDKLNQAGDKNKDKPKTAAPKDRAPREKAGEGQKERKERTGGEYVKKGEGEKPAAKGDQGEKRERTDNGEKRERRDRRPRTEGDDNRPPREKRERPERKKREFDKDWKSKIVVTMDTVIPPMPADRLQKPNNDMLTANLAECTRKVEEYEKEIEKLKDKRHDWRKQQIAKSQKERDERQQARQANKEEWDNNKYIFEDLAKLKKDLNQDFEKKKEVEEKIKKLDEKIVEVEKQFLTQSAMSIEEINNEIKVLEYRQANERFTGPQEKKFIQDLNTLQKSIPVAEKYSKLMKQRNVLRDERKVLLTKMKPFLDQKKALGEKAKDIISKREEEEKANPKKDKDAPKEEKKDQKKEEGEKKKQFPEDPFSKKIEEFIEYKKQMFKKRDKLREEHNAAWDKFYDQQDKIREIEYMTRQKEHLSKIEKIKEAKARELRNQMIEDYLVENTPKEDATNIYRDELAACELLGNYLTSILPQNKKLLAIDAVKEESKVSEEELMNRLKNDKAFAGLKVTPMATKEKVQAYNEPKKKGGKKKETKKEQPKVEETKEPEEDIDDPNRKLIFDLQIRNAFSTLQMEPPGINKELEGSITSLDNKRKELESQIKAKAEEISNLRKQAEASVPTLEELKEKFKDAPTREDYKGSHGHKDRERRAARGGRNRENSGQWRGAGNQKHPRRVGDEEKADLQDYQEDDQGDSYNEEIQRRQEEKRSKKKNANLTEADFPTL